MRHPEYPQTPFWGDTRLPFFGGPRVPVLPIQFAGQVSKVNILSIGLPEQESIANLFRQLGVDLVEEKPPWARD